MVGSSANKARAEKPRPSWPSPGARFRQKTTWGTSETHSDKDKNNNSVMYYGKMLKINNGVMYYVMYYGLKTK